MKAFLVHWSYDSHHAIYGIFETINEFIIEFNKEDFVEQARLYLNYQIDEMEGKLVIDSIYVEDIIDKTTLSVATLDVIDRGF